MTIEMVNKPILIDSIYTNSGGALSLLHYLVETLQHRNIDFFLLADVRCEGEFNYCRKVIYLFPKLSHRRKFYKEHRDCFHSVFCFGNIPSPIRLRVPVFTYFHNINMLTLANCRNREQKFMFWLKRLFIRAKKNYTDEWFVQTSNTAKELINHLSIKSSLVSLFPFYRAMNYPTSVKNRCDYVYVGEPSGSKGHKELLEAWRLLHRWGVDLNLHLTVSHRNYFAKDVENAIRDGVRIINHGYVDREELASIYMLCKATVYPSYNESLGLGLVEAMEAGCDVLASNRPFVFSICKPSLVFDNTSPTSIAETVMKYENGRCPQTEQKVRDMVNEMIDRII